MAYCSPLIDLRAADESRFGGKSANLGELLAAEIPVPPGFGVSIRAFEAFVAGSALEATIDEALAAARGGEVDATVAAAHAIGEAMRGAPVPADVRAEVARCYAALAEETDTDDPPVAVRSSAIGEDSRDATFAGQQETYLWIRGVEPVCESLRDCWISLFSAPAISYRARLGDAVAPAMGVTVQLMVDAAVAGVMFTCNPVTGDPSMVAVDASWGLGLAVVGGEVTPDDFLVSKVTREIVREHVHDKTIEYAPDPEGPGVVRLDIVDERRTQRCLDESDLTALADTARRIERYFGCHQDIEWAIARGDGELFVVQSRPVTALPERAAEPVAASAVSSVMRTFGVGETGS